ncbi:MAG: hypothetical protein COA58_11450 [Bacteroidetes bacterium]|nr:MAG: hypothetical protein COA58_11450 [Bacteroidota bacterium]
MFLIYRTIELIRYLISNKLNDFSILEMVIISFLLTLFITGIFAFIGFAYPTNRLLTEPYYKIKNPKLHEYLYKVLGLKYFRTILLITFWGKKNNRKKYFNGTKKGLNNFIYQTKQSEFGHLGAFFLILICSIILLLNQLYFIVLIMTILNIIGNVYPIILQRFHRIRIEKITNYNTV